jgi:hypothetical protein
VCMHFLGLSFPSADLIVVQKFPEKRSRIVQRMPVCGCNKKGAITSSLPHVCIGSVALLWECARSGDITALMGSSMRMRGNMTGFFMCTACAVTAPCAGRLLQEVRKQL